jgi:large subunit ribosomal protein L11
MAKELKIKLKLQVPAGNATPTQKIGSSLGQHGVNIMEFCKQFNAATASKKGATLPVILSVYTDRSFTFEVKTPPVSELIKKEINVTKGATRPKTEKVGRISWDVITRIAKIKLPDLNTTDLEQAKKSIAGSARSMGIDVVD